MGTVTIDYGYMDATESAARRAASACESYATRIASRVTKKIDQLQCGSTGNTSSSSYFAQQKIRKLNAKHDRYITFADKVRDVKDYAREKDKSVSSYIKTESNEFRKEHGMEVNKVVEWFTWLTTTIINETSFGRWVSQLFKDAKAWIGDKARDFKRWFHLDGGKYIIKTVLAVVGTVIAVVFLVAVAWPAVVGAFAALATASGAALLGAIWTAITAVAGLVTAAMTVCNNITKAYGNAQAYLNNEEDPGWAKRYGEYDSVSDYLRKTKFSAGWMNEWSYKISNAYDTIEVVTALIGIADLFRSGYKFSLRVKEQGIHHVFDKISFRNKAGKVTKTSFKFGMSRVQKNWNYLKDGINSTNINRLTSFYKKNNLSKTFVNIMSGHNRAEAFVSTYEAFSKDGFVHTAIDKSIDHIKDSLNIGDCYKKLKNTYDNIKTLDRNMKESPV